MKTRTHGALLAGALLLAGATAIRAQDAQPDHRWQAWLGCWEPTDAPPESATQLVCVIPATGTSAVEILTVAAGRIVAREHVAASAGARRVASSRNGCAGWESAEWSPQGQRVYLRAEYACPDGLRRSSSGLMAMSATGEWLDVQGVALPGGQTGVRVRRYREAGALSQSTLPEEIAAAPGGGGSVFARWLRRGRRRGLRSPPPTSSKRRGTSMPQSSNRGSPRGTRGSRSTPRVSSLWRTPPSRRA